MRTAETMRIISAAPSITSSRGIVISIPNPGNSSVRAPVPQSKKTPVMPINSSTAMPPTKISTVAFIGSAQFPPISVAHLRRSERSYAGRHILNADIIVRDVEAPEVLVDLFDAGCSNRQRPGIRQRTGGARPGKAFQCEQAFAVTGGTKPFVTAPSYLDVDLLGAVIVP